MAKPIALCIEREGASDDERYVRCTARPGREAGLALGIDGSILWCEPGPVACEVWVSADQRLIAYRPAGAPPVRLQRLRRSLVLPEQRPVVVLDQDELLLGALRFRVHVHGVTDQLHPPRPLRIGRAAAVAAALALGVGAVQCSGEDAAETRHDGGMKTIDAPMRIPARPNMAIDGAPDAGQAAEDAALPEPSADASDGVAPIEVREFPPIVVK